jgi:uncharacterized protein Usg
MHYLNKPQIVTVHIIYYRLDYVNLLQEFTWSTEDQVPELRKIHKFLWHWKHHIPAVIKEIQLGVNDHAYGHYSSVDQILKIN